MVEQVGPAPITESCSWTTTKEQPIRINSRKCERARTRKEGGMKHPFEQLSSPVVGALTVKRVAPDDEPAE